MIGLDDKRRAWAKFLIGKLLSGLNSDACASELLSDAVMLDPCLVAAHVEMGFVPARDEDYIGIIETFREAIR